MHVQVDETRRDYLTLGIVDLSAIGREILAHSLDFTVLYEHICHCIELPGRVDDAAALDDICTSV